MRSSSGTRTRECTSRTFNLMQWPCARPETVLSLQPADSSPIDICSFPTLAAQAWIGVSMDRRARRFMTRMPRIEHPPLVATRAPFGPIRAHALVPRASLLRHAGCCAAPLFDSFGAQELAPSIPPRASAGPHHHGHFLWTEEAPASSYSCLDIHICWNEPSDARIEPPIHTEKRRSEGVCGAIILTFMDI